MMDTNSQLEFINSYMIDLSLILSLVLSSVAGSFTTDISGWLFICIPFFVMIIMKIGAENEKIFQAQIDADFF